MVATVQSDNYNFFSRRIGYAVGAYNVVSYISKLGPLYSKNNKFDSSVWNQAVELFEVSKTVERKKASDKQVPYSDHMANFFYYLDVFRKDERIITPLETLEVLGTLSSILEESDYFSSSKIYLTSKIIENDGDYFLNLLLTNFEPNLFLEMIEKNFEYKKEILFKYFRNITVKKNIDDALSIRVQGNLKDLQEIKNQKLNNIREKVCKSRRSWCVNENELSIYDAKNESLNSNGLALLEFLKKQNIYNDQQNFFCVWPKKKELVDRRFLIQELTDLSFDDKIFFENYIKFLFPNNNKEIDLNTFYEIIFEIFQKYQSLYLSRKMMRNQIKSTTLKIIFYIYISLKGFKLPNFDEFVNMELKSEKPRFNKIILRGHDYGIKFKK